MTTALQTAEPYASLERAVQIEQIGEDLASAAAIYEMLLTRPDAGRRTKAEAAFRLATNYSAQARYAEAKKLYLRIIRDWPEAEDIVRIAEDEMLKVTAALARDQVSADPAAPQHFGDIAIALLGALENRENERAAALLNRLETATGKLAPEGGDPSGVFARLRAQTAELKAALQEGGINATLAKLRRFSEFETFLSRTFPADPNDLFAPAWRMKDRIARALAAQDNTRTTELATALERYLAPVSIFPVGIREGSLARLITTTIKDIAESAKAGDWANARKRLDQFDQDRHEQFPSLRSSAAPPVRVPESAVGAQWAALTRAELAMRELGRRGFALALDHAEEGRAAALTGAAMSEGRAAEHFRAQADWFQTAATAIREDRLNTAQIALRKVGGK